MDIYKAILELKAEKQRLDRAIAALEPGNDAAAPAGRRTWNATARRAAAERMKKYWAKRRQAKSASSLQSDSAVDGESLSGDIAIGLEE
jgi:peptidoglycan hydrolase CwlO-like protein